MCHKASMRHLVRRGGQHRRVRRRGEGGRGEGGQWGGLGQQTENGRWSWALALVPGQSSAAPDCSVLIWFVPLILVTQIQVEQFGCCFVILGKGKKFPLSCGTATAAPYMCWMQYMHAGLPFPAHYWIMPYGCMGCMGRQHTILLNAMHCSL